VKRLPLILSAAYLVMYAAVLLKNVVWSVGDQTDVVRTGIAAFPLGLLISVGYPGGRAGAFMAVSVAAVLNALIILVVSQWIVGRLRN
jgi:hypothetical protein